MEEFLTPQIIEFLLLLDSFTCCIALVTIIFNFSKAMERKNKTVRMVIVAISTIIIAEFFVGFLQFIYVNPLHKWALLY
ncbi:hypothetical protein ES703_71106 [subsurface metagenome]